MPASRGPVTPRTPGARIPHARRTGVARGPRAAYPVGVCVVVTGRSCGTPRASSARLVIVENAGAATSPP